MRTTTAMFSSSIYKAYNEPLNFSNIRGITSIQVPLVEPDLIILNSKEKYKMIKNKIILICFIYFIPFCLIIFTLSFPSWFYLNENGIEYFLGLIYVYDVKQDSITAYDSLIRNTSDEVLENKCYMFFSFGIVIFVCLIVGVVLNLITIVVLLCMISTNQIYKKMKKRRMLNLKFVEKLPGIAYFISATLFLVCGLVHISKEDKFSICFYLAFLSGLVYLINMGFLFLAKKKLKRKRIVDKLLNIEGNDLLKNEFPIQTR